MRLTALTVGLIGLVGLSVSACSDDDEPASEGQSPEEVMELAKTTVDETSGLSITLSTDELPDGVTGIVAAEGVGTHAPAFEGTITVRLLGNSVEVPVIAVDGEVHAILPLTSDYQTVDPGEYGAPDPAQLMSPDEGFSSLLPATADLEAGESVRGGEDNKEVLTEYTGTVPGSSVANVIPSAEGDFDVTYSITSEGELREAVLTGVFYPASDEMTYTLGFDDYGTEPDITAP
ncbi:MAG: LppX_LprAFG lipoprotein [Actinomycetota bacterium]|nr:LppX_LprAFG lipoprotein [Actinomycetota bacterium]